MSNQPIPTNPTEVLRVYLPGGRHADYPATDFNVSREGVTLWRETPRGSREHLAHFPPGQYLRVERVAADTPPPDEGEPFAIV